MKKYLDKYRIPSTRAQWWDYTSEAAYFVTINTKNRVHYFGKIRNGVMCLSEIGALLHHEWEKSVPIRKDMNLKLGEFVVMPDHFHGIVLIGNNVYNQEVISTIEKGSPKNQFGPQRKNLASIIGGVKTAVTIQARIINPAFSWQPRYHDRIVRDQEALDTISNYIRRNTSAWKK